MARLKKFMAVTTAGLVATASGVGLVSTAVGAAPAPKSTFTIGVMNAMTGSLGFVGQDEIAGMNIAVSQINKAGGVNGHKFSLKIADDQAEVDLGTTNLKRLASQDSLPVIIGPGITSVAEATAPLTKRYKTVMITLVGQPQFTFGQPYVYEVVGSQNSNDLAMVKYAQKIGMKTVGILATNDAYGTEGLGLLGKDSAAAKMTIKYKNTWDPSALDLTPQATAVAAANPAALLLQGDGGSTDGLMLKAIRAAGYKGKIIADVTYATETLAPIAGNSLNTIVALSQINYPSPDAITKGFFTAFEKRYHNVPSSLNAEGYDAVMMVAAALPKVSSWTGVNFASVFNKLTFKGVLGTHHFTNTYHQGANFSAFIPVTFVNGKFAAVGR